MNKYKDFFSFKDIPRSEDLNTENYYQIEIVKKILSFQNFKKVTSILIIYISSIQFIFSQE